jgi:hypothetical protein
VMAIYAGNEFHIAAPACDQSFAPPLIIDMVQRIIDLGIKKHGHLGHCREEVRAEARDHRCGVIKAVSAPQCPVRLVHIRSLSADRQHFDVVVVKEFRLKSSLILNRGRMVRRFEISAQKTGDCPNLPVAKFRHSVDAVLA